MFFTNNTNLFCKRLDVFRKCFSKPQWTHFKIYIHGLFLGEKGEKNIEDIASNVLDGKDQSSLNRFLTRSRWGIKKLNAIRLKESIHDRKGGVIVLDDMLIEKFGKLMGNGSHLLIVLEKIIYIYFQLKNLPCVQPIAGDSGHVSR